MPDPLPPKRPPTLLGPDAGAWIQWVDGKLRYIATAGDTEARYTMSTGSVPPGGGAMPHRHGFGVGFYVVEGLAEFVVDGVSGRRTVELGAGGFVHIPPWIRHAVAAGADGVTLGTVAAPAGLDRFQTAAGSTLTGPGGRSSKTIDEITADLAQLAPDFGIEIDPPDDDRATEDPHIVEPGQGPTYDTVGDRYRFLADSGVTGGQYALWHATVQPGGGPPPHRHHREDEAFLMLRGEMTFEADGAAFTTGPFGFAGLPLGGRHQFRNESDGPCELLMFVAPAGLETMFQKTGVKVDDPTEAIHTLGPDDVAALEKNGPDFGIEVLDEEEGQ